MAATLRGWPVRLHAAGGAVCGAVERVELLEDLSVLIERLQVAQRSRLRRDDGLMAGQRLNAGIGSAAEQQRQGEGSGGERAQMAVAVEDAQAQALQPSGGARLLLLSQACLHANREVGVGRRRLPLVEQGEGGLHLLPLVAAALAGSQMLTHGRGRRLAREHQFFKV
ncbi:hypothetical protein ACP_1333 [Acidobacterium capsulatum ATCC 51196]|uniref:Uncharacterized protein n=1 Tax=Acidobacterium capsulatum (strain ATCC 51196 / DSM 11244 / BCRC 80197 / JCM 7670 / NBRC 15755 / NCIMB 13165 / 161) TaxID=240015 RepID=C1F5F8_ACIC5|nr:hypothetical protein ACP_1333 [Acidobacterium capsulatum ATCC 51196]